MWLPNDQTLKAGRRSRAGICWGRPSLIVPTPIRNALVKRSTEVEAGELLSAPGEPKTAVGFSDRDGQCIHPRMI